MRNIRVTIGRMPIEYQVFTGRVRGYTLEQTTFPSVTRFTLVEDGGAMCPVHLRGANALFYEGQRLEIWVESVSGALVQMVHPFSGSITEFRDSFAQVRKARRLLLPFIHRHLLYALSWWASICLCIAWAAFVGIDLWHRDFRYLQVSIFILTGVAAYLAFRGIRALLCGAFERQFRELKKGAARRE